MQKSPYVNAIPAILAEMEQGEEENEGTTSPQGNEYDVYIESNRVTIIKKDSEGQDPADNEGEDSLPPVVGESKQPHFSYALSLLLMFSLCFLQTSSAASTALPTATVTLFEKTQTRTLSSTLQLGRVVNSITLSQEATAPTTGHGHTPATTAGGILTFYNGSFSSQAVSAGSVFTGSDGVQVQTDAPVIVPANNPPQDGEASIAAHALLPGNQGNIAALDINAMVSSSLFVKNLTAFTGGQNERNFQAVAQSDIDTVATSLKATLSNSMQAALQTEVQGDESFQLLPCPPTVTADHQAHEEATQVKVIVTATCTGIAYHTQELHDQATTLLTAQAVKQLGASYSLLGEIMVTVTLATITPTTDTVVLSFSCRGTWGYALHAQEQEHLKRLIAGKPRLAALRLLGTLPGTIHASITGIADNQVLPADSNQIHLLLVFIGS